MPTIIEVLEQNARTIEERVRDIERLEPNPSPEDVRAILNYEEKAVILDDAAKRYGGSFVTESAVQRIQSTAFKLAVNR